MSLSRKVFIPFLILIYFAVINGNLISLAEYLIRYDYIVKNLCVQKNNIKNTCKGSCHLKQNLEKVNESNGSNPESIELKLLSSIDIHYNQNISLFNYDKHNCKRIALQNQRKINQFEIEPETQPPE